MLYWWFRLDTSRSGARWIDGDIPAAGVRRRCDTQVDRQNEYFSPPERTTLSPGRAAQKELRLPRRANRAHRKLRFRHELTDVPFWHVSRFPDSSMIDQRVDFSVGTPLKEVMRKLRVVPSYPKDHVHSRFDVKTGYGARPAANPATRRSNSHPAGFFLGLEHHFAAFASCLQLTGAAGRFVHKDALVAQTNGRRRKEMRIVERRIRSWLTSSFCPARSMGPHARARKGRNRSAGSLDATLF